MTITWDSLTEADLPGLRDLTPMADASHLGSRSLQSLAAEGASEAWLTVNVDNPAADPYTRLGFETYGKRARFSSPAR